MQPTSVQDAKLNKIDIKVKSSFVSKSGTLITDTKKAFSDQIITGISSTKNDAKITIVEYSDFQCPFCSRGYDTMKALEQKYGDKIRVIYKHLPLEMHPQAMPAAQYFEAIALQDHGKAQKFHDMVFENQQELNEKKEKFLDEAAKKVGADLAKVKKDIKTDAVNDRIKKDMAEAQKFGFSGTPGFLVNGIAVRGAVPPQHFESIIERLESDKE